MMSGDRTTGEPEPSEERQIAAATAEAETAARTSAEALEF